MTHKTEQDFIEWIAEELCMHPSWSCMEQQFHIDVSRKAWNAASAPLLSRIAELEAENTQQGEALEAARDLVSAYVANAGTEHQFISCITLGSYPECSKHKIYKDWDKLRAALISQKVEG